MSSRYKLLVTDLDGTLVENYAEEVSQVTLAAFRKAKDIGAIICFATGKSLENARNLITNCELTENYHVLEGGARIIGPNFKPQLQNYLLYDNVFKTIQKYMHQAAGWGICSEGKWKDNLDLDRHEKSGISVFSFHYTDPAHLKELMTIIEKNNEQEEYDINIGGPHWIYPQGGVIMFTAKGVSKQQGVEFLQKKYSVSLKETIVIGDNHNDLPMFAVAGLKVAVENASLQLKEKADLIGKSVQEDAVADIIEKYILK